jgi:hypothetical protein
MRKFIAILVATTAGIATCAYQNASLVYSSSLPCPACVRGGYDFCHWSYLEGGLTTKTTNCTQAMSMEHHSREDPEKGYSWVCSKNYLDQMNAILNSCDADLPLKRDAACGDYLIDLSSSNGAARFRPITTLSVGVSCTYRIFSTCGYPTLRWETIDPRLSNSFDLAYATISGMTLN